MARIEIKDLGEVVRKATIGKYNQSLDVAIKKWRDSAATMTKAQIIEMIQSGQSPVEGGRGQTGGRVRFIDYSKSYKSAIQKKRYAKHNKKLRPINLTLSGEMLRSIKSRPTKEGFSVWFTSPLAKYHNVEGAGKSKVKRKMLPVDKEDTFSRVIMKNLTELMQRILTVELKRD